jgi:hypothetical protein
MVATFSRSRELVIVLLWFLFLFSCLCIASDLDRDRDNAMVYAQRLSADGVSALTRGTEHICSALYYVNRSERTSTKRGRCSMLFPVVYVGMLRSCEIDGVISLDLCFCDVVSISVGTKFRMRSVSINFMRNKRSMLRGDCR